jgi:CRP/FNR family cyclic AMP-dependent transcriptional regulator
MKPDVINLDPGELLFSEGDRSVGLYLIQEGNMQIFRTHENIEVTLAILKAGDVIGTMTLVSKSPRTASARAKTKCSLYYLKNETLKETYKDIPVWAQAVIKDTITRLKDINDKLMEAHIRERELKKHIGTVYIHCSQLSYLLATLIRKGSLLDDTKTPLFPVKDFLQSSEFILSKRFTYLEKIFSAMEKGGLFRVTHNQKYGKVIARPNAQLLEDFGSFTSNIAKKGMADFVPTKYYKWMLCLIDLSKKYNNVEQFEKSLLMNFFKNELKRDDVFLIMKELVHHDIIVDKTTSVKFSATKIQKTIVFESIARILKEIELL